jgi:uncharacterized protein YdeI (YjbR/CyaY-like superfamily)
MQEIIEENKVLKKALIIASSSLKETESKLKKIKEENTELSRSVPQHLHMKLDMPLVLDNMYKKLSELRQAAVINKNIRLSLLTQVQELRNVHNIKESNLKALKKKTQIEKKGSYSQLNMSKRTFLPITTPKHKKNKSDNFFFG